MGKQLYLDRVNDTPEALKSKGTVIQATVIAIRKKHNKFKVQAFDGSKDYESAWLSEEPKVGVGTRVNIYVDDVDADGEYYMEVERI